MLNLRIHHIFDIIRDLGQNKEIKEHEYGHSYHIIAKKIYSKTQEFKLTISNDDICNNCTKLINNKCIDTIDHRKDYSEKELFNNYLDKRIMSIMGFYEGQIFSLDEFLNKADLYVKNIGYIYSGNDEKHTQDRKSNVFKGLDILRTQHPIK
jgi:hypothetical protein